MTKSIVPSAIVNIKAGAVYGGLSTSRGAKVPNYITGLRRYTVADIAVRDGVSEAWIVELMSWIATVHLTAI